MRKYSSLMLPAAVLTVFGFTLSSCKDDDPPVPPKLSFATTTITAKESDDNLIIEVKLDKAASENITIDYTIGGTAGEKVAVGTTAPADYGVVSDYKEVTIAKGETTGTIELEFYSDSDLENDETIELSITEVSTEDIDITRDDEVTITLKNEDGLLVFLGWGDETNTAIDYSGVDMDLFLFAEDNAGTLGLTNYRGVSGSQYSTWVGGDNPEFLFLPGTVDDGSYGVSCTYYEGKTGAPDPMKFEVSFITIVNGDDAATITKAGSYTAANINKWDDETNGKDPLLAVSWKKAGSTYSDFTDIVVPASSSRAATSTKIRDIRKSFKRTQGSGTLADDVKAFIRN